MNTNHEPDSPEPPEPPGFFTWLRGLGIVRGGDRWFAGVAGGIAEKAGIDPLIVRGVFVVLALLGGPGVLLYLAGWLLLPDASGRIQVEEMIHGRSPTSAWVPVVVVVAIFVVPAVVGSILSGFNVWNGGLWGALGIPGWLTATASALLWIGILVALGFWGHRIVRDRARAENQKAQPDRDQTRSFADRVEGEAQDLGSSAEDWGRRAGESAGQWGKDFGERAEAWGDDVGRRAEEWSARYAERHEARRLGAGQAILTIALALLAAGATALLVRGIDAPRPGSPDTGLVAALVAGLAVLAVSLIVAGVRGKHTGWVGFLSACSLVALLFTAVLPWGTRFQPFGNMHVDGAETPGAVLLAGNIEIDLGGLGGSDRDSSGSNSNSNSNGSSNSDNRDVVVWQLFGNSTVQLPEAASTTVDVRVLAGNVHEGAGGATRTSGPFLSRKFHGGGRGEPEYRVSVTVLFGNVTVEDPSRREREEAR